MRKWLESENNVAVLLVILGIVGYLVQYGFNVFLAQHLSSPLYGDVSLALQALVLLSGIVLIGTDVSAKRFLSIYLHQKISEKIQRYITWNLRFIRISLIICWICAILAIIVMNLLHYFTIKNLSEYHIIVYILWITPIAALYLLLASYLLCNKNIIIAMLLQNIFYYVLLILFFALSIYCFNITLNNLSITSILAITLLLLFLIEIIILYTKSPHLFHLQPIKKDYQEREWSHLALKLFTNTILFTIISMLSLAIVELLSHNEASVGYYAACLIIVNFLFVVSNAICQLIKPKISLLLATDKPQLQKLLNITAIGLLILITLISILIIIFSDKLLSHFGAEYTSAQQTLIILVIAYAIHGAARPAIMLLAYSDQENFLLIISIVELSITTLLGITLTHYFNGMGMAIATLISMIVKTLLAVIRVRVKLSCRSLILF